MPVTEKLKLVTKLWNDIAASHEPVVVPPEIIAEATRRSAEIKADPSLVIDDDEMWRLADG